MTPDPKEPTRAKADLAPVSANEPQRSPIQSLASKIAARIHDEANVFNRNNELYYRNDIAFEIIAEELHRCGKFVESAKPKPVVTLNVSPDASPETIEALGKMAEAAVAQMAAEPTPQRSAEVQAAMDWALPHEEWGKLSAKRMEQTAKIVEYNSANAARILRAEVLRLESERSAILIERDNLREALAAAVRELARVDSVKDGHPLVSHNLMYNLRTALATTPKGATQP